MREPRSRALRDVEGDEARCEGSRTHSMSLAAFSRKGQATSRGRPASAGLPHPAFAPQPLAGRSGMPQALQDRVPSGLSRLHRVRTRSGERPLVSAVGRGVGFGWGRLEADPTP
jgi:hypothetical protein